jgi:hypothetical protein
MNGSVLWVGASREALELTKSHQNSAETTNLSYFIMSIPKDGTYEEKIDRLADVAETLLDVEGSDVMCFSMWCRLVH